MNSETKMTILAVLTVGFLLLGGVGGCMVGRPYYTKWTAQMEGEADLAKAESTKKIAVETAKAKRDAAEMEAEAEVTRANGVAKANKIIGDSLKENESYLRYLWIMSIDHESAKTIIYIPTEANLPILEAGRLGEHKEPQPKEQK